MRRSKSTGHLTEVSTNGGKRRGPRTEISDAQLQNRRSQFVQIFEGCWGEIGWELPRCKKADDLASILRPLAESRSWIAEVVEIFCRPSSEPFSAPTLRKVRSERRRLAEPLPVAEESLRISKDRLHKLDGAFTQARGRSRRIVKRARKQRRKELWKISVEHQKLADSEKRLKARLRSLQGSFARQELFRFIKSKRYELTPLHFADAVAGLPHMGWRQSMRKNAPSRCPIVNGRSYEVFKAVRYLVEPLNKKTEKNLVKSFRDSIRLLPSRYRLPQQEFAKSWLYLERAIRQSFRAKLPRKALAFEITKNYFKQLQTQSHLDTILAEQAQIPLNRPKVSATEHL
jgi:hypothetical protein